MATVHPFVDPALAKLNIIGAEALFGPLPPVRWLCQSLRIAAGAPTLFAGYGYSGKSVALQSMALSVASGRPLWGRYACARGNVLHMDYEQGRRITSERYQRMAFAEAIDVSEIGTSLEVGVLPEVGFSPDLCKRLGERRTLILVDSWRAAHSGVDENSSEVRGTLDAMGQASEVTGCTFVVLLHSRKPQKDAEGGKYAIRGSSGFFDGAQTVYLFDGTEVGRPLVKLEKDRIQGAQPTPFRLVIEDTDGRAGLRVRVEDVSEEPTPPTPSESFDALRTLLCQSLKERPGQGATELAERVGKRKSSVLAAVQSLLSSGALVKLGNGHMAKLYLPSDLPRSPIDDA